MWPGAALVIYYRNLGRKRFGFENPKEDTGGKTRAGRKNGVLKIVSSVERYQLLVFQTSNA